MLVLSCPRVHVPKLLFCTWAFRELTCILVSHVCLLVIVFARIYLMSKHVSSRVPAVQEPVPRSLPRVFPCVRRFKLIPPSSGFFPRGEHPADSSLYLRMPLNFYRSHLRTCVRLLVEMYIDRCQMLEGPDPFVCEEMRVLVSWVTSENAMLWSPTKVAGFVKRLCVPLGLDWYSSRCHELPPALMRNIFDCCMIVKKSAE